MEFRLSHGDDVNFVFGFRVADRHDGRAKKSGGIEALLAAVIADIFHREGRPVEYSLGILEIKAVLFQVGRALGRFPREFHGFYYTYDYIYCKQLTTQPAPGCWLGMTLALTRAKQRALRAFSCRVERVVYARHGHEFME
jgi:hypothetical protein